MLQTLERQTGANPRASVIVLHGLGADGSDFLPIAGELDLAPVGDVRFVFPHAPTRPVTINGGYVMRAWYDILDGGLVRREDEAGLRQSREQVDELIAREVERGIAPERIVLAGFSQGSAITLLTGLRHAQRLAGLVGLSGYLPLAASTAAERHAANHATPVFLAHGRQDPVVPYAAGTATRDALQALGVPVEWHAYEMAHAVCPQEIADLEAFLRRVLA
jgi:phospholipase/carboxylesterase